MQRAIAVDFDGCLCRNAWPDIGEPNWSVINDIKEEKRNGSGIILWTCRTGKYLEDAIEACNSWGLEFDTINESLPNWIEEFGNDSRKVGATEYWDDKAVVKRAL